MPNILGIEFEPMNIPLKQRLQTLSVFMMCFHFFFFGVISTIFMISLLFSSFFMVPLFYFVWIYFDKDTFQKGRLQMWYRRLPIWRYCAEYFPIILHKTIDLDPNENYIFGYHPHGVMSTGAFLNFATEGTWFSRKFPGIIPRLVVVNVNFWMPVHRESALLNGVCSANKESIEWIISKNGKGNAAVIAIGGSAEVFDAIPYKMELTLKSRTGFVKLALKHGVSLVPVISFGENELYSQTDRSDISLIKRLQRKFTHIFKVPPVIFHGRGVLQYNFGFVSYRKPINTIVGKPIKVPQILNPSQEHINKYHELYVESLCDLFYANREHFSENPNIEIVIK